MLLTWAGGTLAAVTLAARSAEFGPVAGGPLAARLVEPRLAAETLASTAALRLVTEPPLAALAAARAVVALGAAGSRPVATRLAATRPIAAWLSATRAVVTGIAVAGHQGLSLWGTAPDNRHSPARRGMSGQSFMEQALAQAERAAEAGEVPVGCVIVHEGAVIASAGNRTLTDRDPTAHAEVLAIREAARKLGSERLSGCDLYVTLEPCAMCAAAISFARIRRLYYGAGDPKGGAVDHGVRFFASPTCHHLPEVYSSISEAPAAALLRDFFRGRR